VSFKEHIWWPIRDWLNDARRIWFGSYEIDDPRPIAKNAPYTFYLPNETKLKSIEIGDEVQVIFRSVPIYKIGGERMWINVDKIDGDAFSGILVNQPEDMPQLNKGERVDFFRWQVIDISWKDAGKANSFASELQKQIWDRCMVDQEILNGTARVGYLYRETPDLAGENDKYPDSGWRIRADERDLTDEEFDNPKPAYIAIGKVLNEDDSWLHLIDSEIETRFLRNPETELFEVTD